MSGIVNCRVLNSGVGVAEEHEVLWKISNFKAVESQSNLLAQQKCVIETGKSVPNSEQREKWVIELKARLARHALLYGPGRDATHFDLTCKLEEILTAQKCSPRRIRFQAELMKADDSVGWMQKSEQVMQNESVITLAGSWGELRGWNRGEFFDADTGALTLKLTLTVYTALPATQCEVVGVDENFRLASTAVVEKNLECLLECNELDLVIVCKDGEELKAHQTILMENNAVFEKMLTSGLSEQTSGVINVTDIGGKAMQLVLDFLYTGKVPPTWRDEDVVVEFTYAAGKYGLDEVLKHVDATLGATGTPNQDMSSATLVALFHLATNLGLEQASKRLKEKLVKLALAAKTEAEIISIFQEMNLNNGSN